MMWQRKRIFALLACLAAFPAPCSAGIVTDPNVAFTKSFSGRWTAENGANLTIKEEQGLLEIWGEDQETNFHTDCIYDPQSNPHVFTCKGRGHNFKNSQDFIYSSSLVLNVEINGTEQLTKEIVEEWTAKFWNEADGKIEVLSGSQKFEPSE